MAIYISLVPDLYSQFLLARQYKPIWDQATFLHNRILFSALEATPILVPIYLNL
jgi:hypothetical protein